MAQSHPRVDINSSNSSPREASPVSLPTPIRLVSISLSSGMDMKEKTEDANDEDPKQEGGKSHGGAIPLQIDEAAAPSPSSKAQAQPRPWWLSILFVTLSFIVIASVLVAIIMRYHEGILTAARWCQERQPWSIILNGCIIVGVLTPPPPQSRPLFAANVLALTSNILGFPTMPIEVLAGLMFGFGVSTLMLTISKPIGAVLCAMLSRRCGRGRRVEEGVVEEEEEEEEEEEGGLGAPMPEERCLYDRPAKHPASAQARALGKEGGGEGAGEEGGEGEVRARQGGKEGGKEGGRQGGREEEKRRGL
ncbi:hypothetical protein NSK_007146 [Nannochloropsis salina CCMP1776]|uniref:Uncharacterized protein n=1 Tax=Nannochloropsis salina CCMP1776 TaxID=1027361 RepID=A0A4D9CZG9_9STRA|nr:hypothetical protein NSK_007146 [Nannochloropsis salina CCMP1776]|eukprot:TFJ81899.1 hypothetical protein NSK_007146 [Nannochloropsis salina CCMP1776]